MTCKCFTWRRAGIVGGIALGLYALLGFVGVPLALHYIVVPKVSEQLNGQMTLAKARFNPFTLRLFLGGVDIVDEQAHSTVSAGSVVADLQWSSLWKDGFVFKELGVTEPFAHIGITEEGQMRLVHLFRLDEPREQPPEPTEPVRLAVAKLAITGGKVLITDDSLPQPFKHEIGPIDLTMDDFDTVPTNPNPHHFVATSASGERVEWEGSFHLNPLTSEGKLQISGINAPQYDPYGQTVANFRVKSGQIAVAADYRIDLTQRPVVVDGSLTSYEITDAQLVPMDSDESFLHVGKLGLRGAKWDLVNRAVRIDEVSLNDGDVLVHRLADGTLNWETYFKTDTSATTGDTAPAAAPTTTQVPTPDAATPDDPWAALMQAVTGAGGPWDIVIGGVSVNGQTIRWHDQTTPRPVEATLVAKTFTLGEVKSSDGFRLPITADLTVNDAPITLKGEVTPLTPALNLAVKVDGLALPPFDPYVEQFALKARFRDGRVFLDGDLTAELPAGQPPAITWRGDARIDSFDLAESPDADPILAWQSFALEDIAFESQPLSIEVGPVTLSELVAAYTILEDGTPAVAKLLPGDAAEEGDAPADTTAPQEPSSPAALPVKALGPITLTAGRLAFVDKSMDPAVTLQITELDATVSKLVNDPQSQSDVDVKAKLQDVATASVKGRINPLVVEKYVDMSVGIDTLPMSTFEPFSRVYLGHQIASGKLTFAFPLKINERQLDGEIKVLLDTFHLGDKVDSPDATKLPVGLALDLLRDPSNKININLPIHGDLDDPKFKFGHLIVQALFNTLANVATAPFKMIGSLVGAGDKDLSQIAFEPGQATISPAMIEDLNLLGKAMQERPALKMKITGVADPVGDVAALKQAKLRRAIQAALAQRLPADDPGRADPSTLSVPDEDYRRIIEDRYAAIQSGELPAEEGDVAVSLPSTGEGATRRAMRGGRMVTVPVRSSDPTTTTAAPPATDEAGQPVEGDVPTFEEMEQAVLAAIAVKAEDLAALANARAQAVHQHFTQSAAIAPDRLTLTDPKTAASETDTPRVEFSLQ